MQNAPRPDLALLSALALLLATILLPATARAVEWPQEITAKEGTIVIYQPQPESLTGNQLTGRAAFSLELNGSQEPVFGAFWFTANIDTDRDTDTALVRSIKVSRVSWADSNDAQEQRFSSIIENAVPENGFSISLDRLSASLSTAEQEQKSLDELKNEPPEIVFRDQLAVLLAYDGEPRFSAVEDSHYERALNAPFVVVRNTKSRECFLSSGTLWYRANDPLGPWTPTEKPPADLVKMLPAPDTADAAPTTPPEIVVATKPTDLISTQGKPAWDSLPGGALLYVTNTETPWLRELSTNNMYVLLSGRWYRSKSQSGPWTFVRADELPASFKDIPPASDIGGLRVAVAGTDEAEQALLDAQIPQTAAIKRSEATLTVDYDGTPRFEKISGTQVAYAVNTGAQVLQIDKRYYAVDNGVWFTATSATGPWVVADEIPSEEISKIPPSSPVYNTTYVNIYQSTPEIVYVGYTPGYMWSFPYYGVPVYGTGWYYPPYWGRYYYPRPPTWGFHVGYNPWTGWNYGVSWSNGFFSFGMSWGGGWNGPYRPWGCCNGWYGGGYRRPPTIINTGDINIGNNVNFGNRTNIENRIGNNGIKLADRSDNLYNRPANRTRNVDRATATRDLKQARPAAKRPNDVYVDRNGNVARHTGDGWEQRENGRWQADSGTKNAQRPGTPATRDIPKPANPPAAQRPATKPAATGRQTLDHSSLNRAQAARSTGLSREMSRARPMRTGGRR